MKLVIVESPAKAKTINKYLGSDFQVVASFGHIRDLPSKTGSVLPDENFKLKYEISSKSLKYLEKIIELAKSADEIYLATDPDREGESISWHIVEALKIKKVVKNDTIFKRIVFNEITKKAVLSSIQNPRPIDDNLVNAQQARRALDYLVGFTLSPILWRKLPGCRSAGRVQSVALRLICERESEIEQFISREYWDVQMDMLTNRGEQFTSRLTHIDGEKLTKFSIEDQKSAEDIASMIRDRHFLVKSTIKKQKKRNPVAPFITSSLQQEASRKLGFGTKKTMQIAQKLYEGVDIGGEVTGLITYMRTDSVHLAQDAVEAIRELIKNEFGSQYLPDVPRQYQSKVKNAQEAHEAIRPTDVTLTASKLAKFLDDDQLKLYILIWNRSVASQMSSVQLELMTVDLETTDKKFLARATGSVITFDGFYKIYQEGLDDTKEEKSNLLPPLVEGEDVNTEKVIPNQHFTEPPPRYSEATLIKELEELGIGRPSTYATIVAVLQDRKYAVLEKKRFTPSNIGRILNAFLVGFFTKYVEYDFTANLELDLDRVSTGNIEWKGLLSSFWNDFNQNVVQFSDNTIQDVINYVESKLDFYLFGDKNDANYLKKKKCPDCSNGELKLKLGKYSAFLACSNYPECKYNQTIGQSGEKIDPSEMVNNDKILGTNDLNETIYLKHGLFGWYVQIGLQAPSSKIKPKRATIPSSIAIDQITLDMALKLLSLPCEVGVHPNDNEVILMGIGRFGPYVKYQGKFISIPKSIDPFAITIEESLKLIENKLNSKKQDKPQPEVKQKQKTKEAPKKVSNKGKKKPQSKTQKKA